MCGATRLCWATRPPRGVANPLGGRTVAVPLDPPPPPPRPLPVGARPRQAYTRRGGPPPWRLAGASGWVDAAATPPTPCRARRQPRAAVFAGARPRTPRRRQPTLAVGRRPPAPPLAVAVLHHPPRWGSALDGVAAGRPAASWPPRATVAPQWRAERLGHPTEHSGCSEPPPPRTTSGDKERPRGASSGKPMQATRRATADPPPARGGRDGDGRRRGPRGWGSGRGGGGGGATLPTPPPLVGQHGRPWWSAAGATPPSPRDVASDTAPGRTATPPPGHDGSSDSAAGHTAARRPRPVPRPSTTIRGGRARARPLLAAAAAPGPSANRHHRPCGGGASAAAAGQQLPSPAALPSPRPARGVARKQWGGPRRGPRPCPRARDWQCPAAPRWFLPPS